MRKKEVTKLQFKKIKYGEDFSVNQNKKKIEINQTSNEFFVTLTSKLGSSAIANPVLFYLVPPLLNNGDISNDLNVSWFEEVSTSEFTIKKSYKYIDVLSIAKKENIDESSIIEKFSNIPKDTLKEIETRTMGQNANPLWQSARHFRITSSNFYAILKGKKENVY